MLLPRCFPYFSKKGHTLPNRRSTCTGKPYRMAIDSRPGTSQSSRGGPAKAGGVTDNLAQVANRLKTPMYVSDRAMPPEEETIRSIEASSREPNSQNLQDDALAALAPLHVHYSPSTVQAFDRGVCPLRGSLRHVMLRGRWALHRP